MKSEDIRELNVRLQDEGLKTESVGAQDVGLKSLATSLLAELTAQVAELNEKLNVILNPPIVFNTENIGPDERMGFPDKLPQTIFMTMEPRATLRDQFAMVALQGMLARGEHGSKTLANTAYVMADDMMEARK